MVAVDNSLVTPRARLFQGLAVPSRLEILQALAKGPLTVGEIAHATGLSQPNTSNHLACLLGCGLVTREKRGRFAHYAHADESIALLLGVADRVVAKTKKDNLECPHCGTSM